jgi:hypothetical protein
VSRVIRTETGERARGRLLQAVALALRATASEKRGGDDPRDVMAFVTMALQEVSHSVEETAAAWEKRGYWLKADRFRADWAWVDPSVERLRGALSTLDWPSIAEAAGGVAGRVAQVKLPARMARTRPWEGAWAQWMATRGGKGA